MKQATAFVNDRKSATVCAFCPTCNAWCDVPNEAVDTEAEVVVGDVQTWQGIAWDECGVLCGECGEWLHIPNGTDD